MLEYSQEIVSDYKQKFDFAEITERTGPNDVKEEMLETQN